MRTLSQTDSSLSGVTTGLASWWLAAVSDLPSIMLSDGNGASNQRCRFCPSVFPVTPVLPKAGGKFCADHTGNIVSDWRSEPSSGNTKRFSSSLTTSQSCSLFGPPSHPQKFRAVWVWLPPSQDAPPSPGAPPSWRRRVKMLRRRWWTPSARLASPASSSAPPSVSEHSCTARCSSTWPPKHTEQELQPTCSEPHPSH